MLQQSDTIAAVSTPAGEGAIGIVRISGSTAFEVSDKVFQRRAGVRTAETQDRKLYYGYVVDLEGDNIDDGFVVFMAGPGSYTGEDSVEIFCHGGVLVVAMVLEAVLKAGARLASAGEFTERAFVNGKLDLTRAEAVIDVIKASTEGALRSARMRLSGTLSKEIDSIKNSLVNLRVRIEVMLDFPEDELEDFPEEQQTILTEIATEVKKALTALKRLLSTYDEGRVLKDGLRVLILGRPNVGKSSLLNLLLKEERAIVTAVPGTTRDIIEEPVNVRSIPVRIIDTAGIRETADMVESIGIEAARKQIDSADLILFVVDLSTPESFEEEKKIVGGIKEKKVLIVGNKIDNASQTSFKELQAAFPETRCIATSTLPLAPGYLNGTEQREEAGPEVIGGLEDAIFELATGRSSTGALSGAYGSTVITNVRHKRSLEAAVVSLEDVLSILNSNSPIELIATDLLQAVDYLGQITGEVTTDDILSKIFSEFCIGK